MSLPLEKRYVHAFLNVFAPALTMEILHAATKMCLFLQEHRRITFMLKLSILDEQVKREGLYRLCDRYHLGEPFKRLIRLLQEDHRLPLLPDVLCHLEEVYMKREQIHPFTVHSSTQLAENERGAVEQFLAEQLDGTILCTYAIEPALIAGIRTQSPTYLWEHSIAKQLRHMETAISR